MSVVIEVVAMGMDTVYAARTAGGYTQGLDEVNTYRPVCTLDHELQQFAVSSKPGPQYLRDRKGDMHMRNRLDQFTDLLAEQDRALRGTTRTGHPHAAGEGHEIVTAAPVAENTGHTVFRDPAVQEGVDRPHHLLSQIAVFLFETLGPDSLEFFEPAFDNAVIIRSFRAPPFVRPGFRHGLSCPLQMIRMRARANVVPTGRHKKLWPTMKEIRPCWSVVWVRVNEQTHAGVNISWQEQAPSLDVGL